MSSINFVIEYLRCDIGAFESLQKLTKLLSDEADSVQLMDIDFLAYFALIRLSRYKQDLELMNDRYLGKVYELVKIAGHKLALNEMVERRSYKLNDHINMAKIIGKCMVIFPIKKSVLIVLVVLDGCETSVNVVYTATLYQLIIICFTNVQT